MIPGTLVSLARLRRSQLAIDWRGLLGGMIGASSKGCSTDIVDNC